MPELAVNKSPAAQPDACPAFLNRTMSGRVNSTRAGLHPGPRVGSHARARGSEEPSTSWRRVAATALPAAMPVVMHVVFRAAARRFGPRRGYQAGFAVYWATCWLAALAVAGPRLLAETFRHTHQPLPTPRALAYTALAAPPVGAVITEFLPHARRAGSAAIGTSIFVGTTNALADEAFWRALPVTVFPGDPVHGWLWPAAWFTAWHLVPLTAAGTARGRAAAVLTGAALIGAGYGWIAMKTGSVAPVLGAHAITDASGVRVAKKLWLGRPVRGRLAGLLQVSR